MNHTPPSTATLQLSPKSRMATDQHFVDIHPVGENNKQPAKGPIKRSLSVSRRVSPESMESKELKAGTGNKELQRSGKSLGAKGDFSIFRTKSGLSKQNSMQPTRKESEFDLQNMESGRGGEETVAESVPVGRYFAALRGPEFDQVKDYEDTLLPKDEVWPFLLRFPIGCFGICLGIGSQAVLWDNISSSPAIDFINVNPAINLTLWLVALTVFIIVFATYLLKCVLYFEAIRREYFHPVRVNFFFAPWIASMFLVIGAPSAIAPSHIHPFIWCVLTAPVFVLHLKIYGQWFLGGKHHLCMVANPSSHLSVAGNFVAASLAAKVNWVEAGKFMWAVGLAHYLVVFVTLYQRLPTSDSLPKELHPVYSMFIATPSAASIAWAALQHEFDDVSKIFYFIAIFLYMSLLVRINFFRGFRFSIAWWSYTFPMTTMAIASVKYADEAPNLVSKGTAFTLSLVSSAMVSMIFISTLLHGLVWKTLFPNDLAIAITRKRSNTGVKSQSVKKSCSIKRRAKQTVTPSLISSIAKSNSGNHDSDGK